MPSSYTQQLRCQTSILCADSAPHPRTPRPSLPPVTPVGDQPGQITREAIAEAEAAEDLADDDVLAGNPSEWDYDESTEGDDDYNQVSLAEDENPPTPILDAYEKSRDPAEMERLIKMSFDSLPERAGPQRYNRKRREHQRYKTIRVSLLREVYACAGGCWWWKL